VGKSKKYLFWEPEVGEQEIALVEKIIRSNFLNDGDVTSRFERELANLLGSKYVVAVTSGTAAIFCALAALGINSGDEVIVPDVTFIATANAVVLTGAKPVFADVDPKTMNMDPLCFERAITRKTKAVIPVHISGRPADVKKILQIAKKNGIHVVEDAAEALMSKLCGKCVGTFGELGCFSFTANKIITTGQGGAVATNNPKFHKRLRELKDQGRPVRGTGGADIHNSIGYNFKFTNLQAAVGLGQLKQLPWRIKKMKEIYNTYKKYLTGTKEVSLFNFNTEDGESPQWIDALVRERDVLHEYLRSKGIYCRKYWYPVHTQKPYKQSDEKFPVSTRLSKKVLWFPSSFKLKERNIKYICNEIKNFYSRK